MKKLLLSTMLVTSLVGGLSETSLAKTLQGQSDWMVRKVQADTPYCTMARQFEADAVLTVAQNARGEGTVALDFKRDAFDITRPYPVKLDVGGVTREYAVKPAVPNALIMRVGGDTTLFNAMQSADLLNVTIDDEKFSLDLGGYKSSREDMNSCLGVQDTPQVAQVAAPQPQQAPSAPQISAQQNARIDTLLAENKRLTQELMAKDRQQQNAMTPAEKAQLLERLKQAEKKNAELVMQMEQMEEDLIASRQSLNPDLSQTLRQRDAQIAELTRQNQSLRAALEETKAQMTSMAQSNGQDDVAMRERLAQLETQAATLKAERDAYQKQLQLKTNELASMNNREPEVIVREVVKEVPVAMPDMAAPATEIASRLAEMETQAATYRVERDEYRRLLQQERLRTKTADEDSAANKNMIAEISRLEAEKAELMRQLAYMESQSSAPKANDTAIQVEIESLRQRLADAQAKLAEANGKASRLERELEVAKITKPVAPVTDDSAKVAALQGQLRAMETRLTDMTREKAMLEEELQRSRMMSSVGQMGDKQAVLESRLQDMEAEVARTNTKKADLASQLDAMRAELANAEEGSYEQQLAMARLKDMEEKAARMAQEKSIIEGKLAEAEAITGDSAQERDSRIAALRQQMSDLQERVGALSEEKAVLADELAVAQQRPVAENNQAQVELGMARERMQEMESLMQKMAQENLALQDKLEVAEQKAQDAAMQVAVAVESDPVAKVEPVEAIELMPEIDEDKKAMQTEIAALEAQNAVLRQDVTQYRQSAEEKAKLDAERERAMAMKQLEAQRNARRSLPPEMQSEGAKPLALKSERMPLPVEDAPLMVQVVEIETPVKTAQANKPFLTGAEIKEIVTRANVPLVDGIARIDRISGPDFAAFRWDTGTVYGSGEQSRMSDVSAFENSVRQYIARTRSRCTGNFDETVGDRKIGDVTVKVADVACVDDNASGAAASVLFFTHEGMFYALAHEADMDTFTTAMDMRDRLANSIGAIF